MTPQIKQRIEQIRRGEVPEGYKKTVAGIIPSEWELHLLSDHLQESRIPGSNGSMAKKLTVKLWNKGVVEKREIHEGSESTTYYSRKSGQLIYSKLDFLNCAFGIIPDHLDGYESTQDLPCFDIDGVNPSYLLTYMTQRSFYSHYGMIADGGRKARRVNPEDMLSFPLIYPSILEQEKIAKVLETQDRVITLYEKKIEQLKKLKKVFLQKMFPKPGATVPEWRFPGFTDGWEKRKVSDLLTERNEQAPMSDEYPLMAFIANEGVVPKGERYDRSSLVNDTAGKLYKKTEFGDFIYSSNNLETGSIGLNKYGNACISPVYSIFQPTGIADSDFIGRRFVRKDFINAMVKWRQGVIYGQWKIHESDFFKIEVAVPSVEEQRKIGAFLDYLDNLITLHQRKCDEEKQKKKALMQLLLTGIVRVKDIN